MFGINLQEAFNDAVDFVTDTAEAVADTVGDVVESVGDTVEDITGQVIDTAEDVVETIEDIGTEVGAVVADVTTAAAESIEEASTGVIAAVTGFFTAISVPLAQAGQSLNNAVSQAADGIADAFTLTVDGLADIFINSTSKLLQGDLIGAAESVITGVDKVGFRAGQRLFNGLINSGEELLKAPTYLLPDPVGSFVRDEVVARTVDIGRTLFNVPTQMSRNAFRTMTETPLEIVKGGVKAVGHLLQGEFSDAGKAFGMGFVNAGTRLVGDVVDNAMIGLQGAGDIIGTALFLHEPSRPLTADEKALLQEHYGDSVDVDSIRVHDGNITTEYLGMAAHAVGNDIYIPSDRNGDDELLVHETTHVWQSQNGGNDYIHKALLAQGVAVVTTGDRNNAYNWRQSVSQGTSFGDLNPEEQAELIEEVEAARENDADGDGELSQGDFSPALSDAEWLIVQAAIADVQAGDNAP